MVAAVVAIAAVAADLVVAAVVPIVVAVVPVAAAAMVPVIAFVVAVAPVPAVVAIVEVGTGGRRCDRRRLGRGDRTRSYRQ